MTAPRLTRRSLLAAVAGSSAISAVTPRPAWPAGAAPATGAPRLLTVPLGDLRAGTHRVRAPEPFDLAGVQWRDPARPRLALRTLGPDGAPDGPWANVSAAGHGPDRVAPGAPRVGDPVWTGRALELELQASTDLRGVALQLVAAAPSAPDAAAVAALALAAPTLPAGPGQPPIIARAAWAQGLAPAPRDGAGYGVVRLAFVHHTENPNGYSSADVPAMLRAIWLYHVQAEGWHDIGYNFVIDSFGRTFEARAGGIDEPVVGAQAGGYNLVSTGVAILGTFSAALPSPPALDALQALLAWKLSLHGVPTNGQVTVHVDPAGAVYSRFPAGAAVTLPRIAGHRDGDSTDCPGDALYARLPSVRLQALALAGSPLVATLVGPTGTLTAPASAALSGSLAALDGTPVPGASVALQSRALGGTADPPVESTIAELTTDAVGQFSLALPVSFNAALRLLFAGAPGLPAAISEPLDVEVAPALTLTASTPSLATGGLVTVSGTVSPPLPRVVVTVDGPPAGGRPATVSTHDLPVTGGTFALSFRPSRSGSYRCVARTVANIHQAAGASPAVTLTVA